MIEANVHGLSFKDIASQLFPTCSIRTAENKLNRALNPDNHDIHFDIEWVDLLVEVTGRQEVLLYWLERNGYDPARLPEIRRPQKSPAQLIETLTSEVKEAKAVLERAGKQLELMVPLAGSVGKKEKRR